MKKLFSLLVTFLFLMASASGVYAATTPREQKIVTVEKNEVVNSDFYLGAGDVVEISGTVNGDVVIAGGQLTIDGVVNGDLLAAGGSIDVSGEVTQDVRIAGGQITISGKVGRNLTAAGGNIDVTSSAEIGGGALFAGGNINVAAHIPGDIYVGAGNLTISNEVDGNVNAGVGSLRLTSQANVSGDLTYYSDTDATIDESASVSGKIERKATPEAGMVKRLDENKVRESAGIKFRFVGFLSALLFGLLMLRFCSNYTKGVASAISENILRVAGIGFLILIIAPLAALFLMITIIGFPLGVLLAFAYAFVAYLSKIYFAVALGSWSYKRFGKKETQYLPFIVGLLLFYLVGMIPYLGGFLRFVVVLWGFGATYISCKTLHKKAASAKLI